MNRRPGSLRRLAALAGFVLGLAPLGATCQLPATADVPIVPFSGRTVGAVYADLQAEWGSESVVVVERKTLANVSHLPAMGISPHHALATPTDKVKLTSGQLMHVYVGGSSDGGSSGLLNDPKALGLIAITGWMIVIVLTWLLIQCKKARA